MSHTCTECGAKLPSHGSLGIHQFSHTSGNAAAPGPPPGGVAVLGPQPPFRRRSADPGQATAVGLMAVVVLLAGIGSLFVVDEKSPATVPVVAGAESAPTTLAAALPAGYRSIGRPDDGFAIALPPQLEDLPLSSDQLAALAESLRRTNPKVASVLSQNKSFVEQARLFALDKTSGNSQIVQRIVVPAKTSIDALPAGMFSDEYRRIGATSVGEARVHIAAGDAMKIAVVMDLGPVTVRVTQHVLVRGSSVWVLTYSEPDGATTEVATTIANTFRFTG